MARVAHIIKLYIEGTVNRRTQGLTTASMEVFNSLLSVVKRKGLPPGGINESQALTHRRESQPTILLTHLQQRETNIFLYLRRR